VAKTAFELAIEYHERGDLAEAVAAYREALASETGDPAVLNNLGIALCQIGRTEEGIGIFHEAIASSPTDVESHFNLGQAFIELGRPQLALASFSKAIEYGPDDPSLYYSLADAYTALGHHAKAGQERAIADRLVASRVASPDDRAAPAVVLPISQVAESEFVHGEVDTAASSFRSGKAGNTPWSATGQLPKFVSPTDTVPPADTREWRDLWNKLSTFDGILDRHGFANEREKLADKKRDLADRSVLVFVVGEGNFGKSSLINSLLGRNVAEVSFKPTTWRIDLYRHSPGTEEWAEIRRWGRGGAERLSLTEAKAACQEQEAAALARAQISPDHDPRQDGAAAAFDGQIIEVSWYYQDIAVPREVVLVDTPGFAQYRAGLNQARATVLASERGVVFDLEETYQHYYHRADLVLWAFRANKINDRDTLDALEELGQQSRTVLGVLTNLDRVPGSQRSETFAEASRLFGSTVPEFVGVVAGGKSAEVGLGIDTLRARLADVGRRAEHTKLASAHSYCQDQARSCRSWLEGLGSTLIGNISKVAQFSNVTSDSLLRESYRCQQALIAGMDERPSFQSSGLCQFLYGLLAAPVDPDLQRRQLAEHLQIEEIRHSLHRQFDLVGRRVATEASSVVRSPEYALEQVVVKSAGRTEPRRLDARLEPPDVGDMLLSLDSITLPDGASGLLDTLYEFFENTFIGGVLAFFGGKRKDERRRELAAKAATQIQEAIRKQIEGAASGYVRAGAGAILASVDTALGRIYDGKGIAALGKYAHHIDSDLKELPRITRDRQGTAAPYAELFKLWSPIDDARSVAIEFFCRWFEENHTQLQAEARGWMDQVLEVKPPNLDVVAQCCTAYLRETKQTYQIHKTVELPSIASKREELALKTLIDSWSMDCWFNHFQVILQRKPLFVDGENFLLEGFQHFQLDGLAIDFSTRLAEKWRSAASQSFASNNARVNTDPTVFREPFEFRARLIGPRPLACASTVGVMAGLAEPLLFGFRGFVQPLAGGLCALGCSMILILAGRLQWRSRQRQHVLSTFPAVVVSHVKRLCQDSWEATVRGLDLKLARQIIATRTLVRKRPLEYAQEGSLADYLKSPDHQKVQKK